jgi:hypothetical protein
MKKAFYTLFLGLFATMGLVATAGAQSIQAPSENGEAIAKAAKPGTFLLIRTGKVEEALNSEVLYLIEQNRKQHEESYFVLSQNLLVKILSEDEIAKPDFVPYRHLYIDEEKMNGGTK